MRALRVLLFALLVAVLATGTALAASPSFSRYLPEFLRPPMEAPTIPEEQRSAVDSGSSGGVEGRRPRVGPEGVSGTDGPPQRSGEVLDRGLHRGDDTGRDGHQGAPGEGRREPPAPASGTEDPRHEGPSGTGGEQRPPAPEADPPSPRSGADPGRPSAPPSGEGSGKRSGPPA